eukprot:99482_1
MVDHLNEEQNDNKPGEETKSNNNADMELKSDATPVNSNAINTVITGPPLTSHFYGEPQVGHPDEEQKDNKHGAKLREEQESAKLREEPEAKRIQKEQAGGNSTNENEDAELTSRTTPNKTDKQTNADQLSGYGVTFPTFTDTSELQIESGVSSNFPPTYTPSGDELADINNPENIRTAPINKKDPPEQHVAAGTNDQNDGFKYNSGSGNQAPSKYNNYNGSNTYSQDISSGQQLHKKEPQNQSQKDSHNALFAQEINKQNDVGGDKGGLRDQEASGFTKIKLDAKADHENDDKETQVYVDITSLDKALQLVNDLPKPNEQEDSEINREELKEEFDDVTVTNSRTHEETQDNGEDDRKESVNRKNDDQMDSNIFHPNSNDGIVDERQLVKYNPQIHSPESKERRIMLDRFHAYYQKTHYSNLDPRIMSFLDTSSKNIANQLQTVKYNSPIRRVSHTPESKERRIMLDRFHAYYQKTHYSNLDPRIMSFLDTSSKNIANQLQTVKYNSPIRRVSHTPESKERRIMLDRVQSYYQKTHFADDYHNDTSNTNDVVFPRFSILQDNSQEGMCFVILYPSASHDSVDNYQILSGVQDVVTESFDARSIQDTTIFPAKVISNTYPKSLILRATLKDGSCIDSGVPLPPPSVAFTLKMGTDNSDTVLDLRRADGITDDEATEYQLSVGPDRDDMSGIIHQFTGKVAHEKNGMLKVDSTNLQGAKVGRIRAIKYIGGRNGNRVISDSFTEIKSDEVSTGHDDDDHEDDVDDGDDNKRSDHDDEHDKRDGEEDDEGGDDDEERVEADGNYDDNDDNNGGEASKDDNVPESHQDGGGGSGDGNEHGVSINDVSESHEHGHGGSGYGSKHGASINDGFDDGKECDTSNFKGSLDGKENESYKGQYVSDDNHVPNKKHNDNDIQHDPTKSTSIANGSNKYDEKEDRVMVGDESKYNESDQHQDAVVESQEDEKNESVRTHKHGEDTKDGEQGIKAAAVVLEDAKGSFTLTKDSEHSGNKGNPVGSNIYERHLRIPRKNLPDQGSINLILEAKNSRSIEFREFIVNGTEMAPKNVNKKKWSFELHSDSEELIGKMKFYRPKPEHGLSPDKKITFTYSISISKKKKDGPKKSTSDVNVLHQKPSKFYLDKHELLSEGVGNGSVYTGKFKIQLGSHSHQDRLKFHLIADEKKDLTIEKFEYDGVNHIKDTFPDKKNKNNWSILIQPGNSDNITVTMHVHRPAQMFGTKPPKIEFSYLRVPDS